MAVVEGVVTDVAREKWAKTFGNVAPESPGATDVVSYFKIAEGGWIDPGGGREPRTPDPTFNDVDVIENPGRYPADSVFIFQKSFIAADLTFEATTTLRVRCFLDFAEANDDGFGNDPEFYEIGVFDGDDVLIAYFTFPLETKNVAKTLENVVRLVF